jgi:hypothetical protein
MESNPTAAPTPPSSLPWWKRLLFASVLLLIVAVVLEVAAQVYLRSARGYTGGEFLQYQFDPYKNIRLTPDWTDSRGVRHSAQGFRRDGLVTRDKPAGTTRIFLMGASTAYGLGGMWPHLQREFEVLDNSETISAYLESILADSLADTSVEVINAGVPSIWTHHHLINLNQTILSFAPDLILFLDGWNDHYFINADHDQFASYAQTEQAGVIMGPPTLASLGRMNAWWLFRRSAFFQVVGRALRALKPMILRPPPPRSIDPAQALVALPAVFERSALRMIERNALILRQEGIPALFLLQPMLALERGNLARMPEIERRLFEFNIQAWAPGYEQFLTGAAPYVARRIEETVVPLGARFADLTGLFSAPSGQIFTDYAHLTPEGNRIVAEHVAPMVVAMLRDSVTTRASGPQEPAGPQ